MGPKIKLEVNHANHDKKESGQKIMGPSNKKNILPNPPQQLSTKPNLTQDSKLSPTKNNKTDLSPQPRKDKYAKEKDDKGKDKDKDTKDDNNSKNKNNKNAQQGQPINNHGITPKKDETSTTKKDSQLETLQRIKQSQKKTKLTIEELIDQYKEAADDIFTNHGHNPQKEKMIAQHLQALQSKKQSRRQRLSLLSESLISQSSRQQQQEQENHVRKNEEQKRKRREKAERKLQSLRAVSQERAERDKQYQDYYQNEYQNKQFLYQKMQENFREREKENQSMRKLQLMKNKEKYKPMNQDELEVFLEHYHNIKQAATEENHKKREFTKQLIESENKQFLDKLWRGEAHRYVQEERDKLAEAKVAGKNKLEKIKQYAAIIHQEFRPKVSQSERTKLVNLSEALDGQEAEIDGKKYVKVAREKFLNGVTMGLQINNMRKSLDHDQQVKKGNQYLEFFKSLPKVKPNEQKIELVSPQSTTRKAPSTTFKVIKSRNPYYSSLESDRVGSQSVTGEKRMKDPQLFSYLVEGMKGKDHKMELEQRAIRHGRYKGVLQLQDRHISLNHKLVQSITQKLRILSRL